MVGSARDVAAAGDLLSDLRSAHAVDQHRPVQPAIAEIHLLRVVRRGGAYRHAGRGHGHRTRPTAGRQEEVGMATTGAAALKRIVVGVDGSDAGMHAVEWTARLAKAMGSEVIAVYALDIPVARPDPYTMPLYLDDKVRAEIEKDLLTKLFRPLKAAGARCRAVLPAGRQASVVLRHADMEKAGLIIV